MLRIQNKKSSNSLSKSDSSSNELINVPKRVFPLISEIYTELNSQIGSNTELKISKKKLKQLKVIINQIEGDTKTFSLHVILYLITKIQKISKNKQLIIIDLILNIFNKFILIERCLLQQNIEDIEIFFELDKQFDRCINYFIRKNIIDIEDIKEYINKIDKEITSYLKYKNIDIAKFKKCNKSLNSDTKTLNLIQNGFFDKIRNIFLLFCAKFNITMKPQLYILFNILQYCGDAVCENITSIDTILKIFGIVYQYSKINIEHIKNIIELYCSINRDIKKDKLLNILLQHLKEKEKEKEKEKDKKQKEDVLKYLENESEFKGNTNSKEKSSSDSKKSKSDEVKAPSKKDYFSRYTNPLTRTLNTQIAAIEEYITNKINELDFDAQTTAMLVGTVVIIKKTFQIEGWNSFISSFNKHSRILLGEKLPGKRPETPFQKIVQGKVYLKFNRATFLANTVVFMPFMYKTLTTKLQQYLEP